MENKSEYNQILNSLAQYFDGIKNYIMQSFQEVNDYKLLSIDFYHDFIINEKKQAGFIVYDDSIDKFTLSISCGLEQYNDLVNFVVSNKYDINYKYSNEYYSYFSQEDRALIIKRYNVDFMAFVKSEFLYACMTKILNIRSFNLYQYKDKNVVYTEKVGFSVKDIIIDVETRLFAKKYGLFYIPLDIGNNSIIREIKWIISNENIKKVLLNDYLENLLNEIPIPQRNMIVKYEQEMFEKKYQLNENEFEII